MEKECKEKDIGFRIWMKLAEFAGLLAGHVGLANYEWSNFKLYKMEKARKKLVKENKK